MIITNARLVLFDRILDGSLVVEGDAIARIDEGDSMLPEAVDFDGDYLIPGLVELHTDNLERHAQPRPGVMWPSANAAVLAHDNQIAGSGITTVLDAVALGEYNSASGRRQMIATTTEAVGNPRLREVLRAEHFLHLRCELADAAVLELYRPLAAHPYVKLVSLMDHTPGQRQWADFAKWRRTYPHLTDAEADAIHQSRLAIHEQYSAAHRREVIATARANGTVLASHDDTTAAHVNEAVVEGIAISEFPTTLGAAEEAGRRGMGVVMGAPNIVRGGSHSGNVSAIDLARTGTLDALSSDYVPASLMQAVFLLARTESIALPDAVAMISAHPADMIGFTDRGRLEPGRRADFSRVRLIDDVPVVRSVWRAGRQVN